MLSGETIDKMAYDIAVAVIRDKVTHEYDPSYLAEAMFNTYYEARSTLIEMNRKKEHMQAFGSVEEIMNNAGLEEDNTPTR